jgi:cobalamin biosynthetic protein CobC
MSPDWQHGGAIDRMKTAFPQAPTPWIDLSTGINPWPYRGSGLDAEVYDRLPTQAAFTNCRNALSEATNAPPESICLAPGSELLIRLLPHLLSCRRVAILDPSYGDYSEVWRHTGSDVIATEAPLSLADSVDAVIVCNPNNPNGRVFDAEQLLRARAKLAARGGWLIVDEAYCDLTRSRSLAAHGGAEGLIILRSFGKFYGLPGLRLGAIMAPAHLIKRVSQLFGAWPVSSAALEIGAKAFRDQAWQRDTRAALQAARQALDLVLESNAMRVIGGTDLFRFVQVDDAHAAWQRLAQAGLYVRRFEDMSTRLRIGLPADEIQLARLNEALSLLA